MQKGRLIEKSKEILRSLKREKLMENGFMRDRTKYEFIVTYPPLPALDPITQEEIFSEKPEQPKQIGLYVHIPFCTGTCTYCSRFVRFPNQSPKVVEGYLGTLEKELEILKSMHALKGMQITSLYFGGGTPTYLANSQLENLITHIRNNLVILPGSEITIEASPETLTKEKLGVLRKMGITRLSIGIQSFNDDVLRLCGRRHNAEQAIKSFEMAREACFNNINLDLISGLPNQSLEIWEHDLDMIEKLNPDSLTVYPLYVQENSLMRRMKNLQYPNEQENLLLNIMVTEKMESLGYLEFPVHFFVRTKTNVLKQWEDKWQKMKEVIGIGVSCYAFFNNTQYHNHLDIKKYQEAVNTGRLPVWRGKKLDKTELMARFVIFGFKTGTVNKEAFEKKFNTKMEAVYRGKLKKLEENGLIRPEGKSICLTHVGMLFSEEVCREFFTEETKRKISEVGEGYTGYSANTSNY